MGSISGENHFLVGVSLDGLKEIHDRYRLDAAGKGTYQRVISAIRLLEKHQVEYNILTVVTAATARKARRSIIILRKIILATSSILSVWTRSARNRASTSIP